MERIVVPAREGRAVRVPAGARFRVVDLEGGQVGDLFAFNAADVSEHASAQHTRPAVGRLFPRPGESFVTNRRRPILFLERDDSPGIHDMLYAACDPHRYAGLGHQGWHASCQENLLGAMEALGFPDVAVPQPINVFMHVEVGPDGSIETRPSPTKAGDSLTLRAEMDTLVALSSCPQDLVQISSGGLTPLALELLD